MVPYYKENMHLHGMQGTLQPGLWHKCQVWNQLPNLAMVLII